MAEPQIDYQDASIFDIMEELIYIADISTHELLFLNKAACQAFHIDTLPTGIKCYELLHSQHQPCPFCNSHKLSQGAIVHWDIFNPILKRHLQLKDTRIHFRGHDARIEVAFDVTSRENEKHELKHALNADHLLQKCLRILHETTHLSQAMDTILERLGRFFSADRTYIFEIRHSRLNNTHEWCARNVQPQKSRLQNLNFSVIDRWMPYFSEHKCVSLLNVETIRQTDPEEYRLLKLQNIHSLIVAPLEINGKLGGFIGLDNPPMNKAKNIKPLLLSLAYFIASARIAAEKTTLLERMSYIDSMTGTGNRNAFIRATKDLEYDLSSHSVGIIFLDLNNLKHLNDTYGHESGDSAIISLAHFLQSFFRTREIYRTGGDEFVVLCIDYPQEHFTRHVEAMQKVLRHNKQLSVALGSVWDIAPQSIEELIHRADQEMYIAKKKYHAEKTV